MQLPLTGGCQCGSVRYQITANPLAVYVCHCTECQRQSGSAFALSLAVAREALVVVEGAPAVWRRELEGGRIIDCLFCGACGVRLFHNPERNPRASIVKPGTLDDTTWLKPVGHIWTRSAQSWVPIPQTTVNYEGQPPDLSRLIEAWKAQDFGFPDEMSAFGLQFGHGLGLALHERPIISRVVSLDHPTEIKEGMVFALETYCPATDGYSAARIEEEVVVTDKGCRVITLFPAEELPIANRY